MKNQIKTQKQICKNQIWDTVTGVLTCFLSLAISFLMWCAWQLHPLLLVVIGLAMFVVLFVVSHVIFSTINKSLYRKLNKFLVFPLDQNAFEEILAEVQQSGVVNVTKQNYFLFFKSTIDNMAFYDANSATTAQELKGLHTQNINYLKKTYPDLKNKYLSENHLRMDVRIFVVDKIEPFLSEYIAKNSNRLAEIGKFRCVIEKNTFTVVIPTLLPNGIGVAKSIFYLKLLNYFYKNK